MMMTRSKAWLPALAAALMAIHAWGAATPANLLQDDWNVGGFVNWTRNSGRNLDSTETTLSASAEYFAWNRLSLGVAIGVDDSSFRSALVALGPGLNYYFFSDGKVAANVGLGFRLGLTDATVNSVYDAQLGFKYFFAPTVALGPSAFIRHFNSRFSDYQRYGLAVNFGIYL